MEQHKAWGFLLAAVWPLVIRGSTHNTHNFFSRRGVAQQIEDAVRVDATVLSVGWSNEDERATRRVKNEIVIKKRKSG